MANKVAPLPNDKVYEVWLLPANGSAPMAAGTFEPDKKGNTLMLHAMENPGIQAEAFAVTIEPRGEVGPTLTDAHGDDADKLKAV